MSTAYCEEIKPKGTTQFQKVTGDDPDEYRSHWDALMDTKAYIYGKEPSEIVKENYGLLKPGRVLDIAMGEGRHAVFLAKKGFIVDGVDFSEVAIRKAKKLAAENHVSITTIKADLSTYQMRPEYYDSMVDIDFYMKSLIPQIKRGLKRGGVIIFEANTVDQMKNAPDQHLNKDWLLEKGELKELFKDFKIISYRETNDGKEAKASLIAKKP